MSRAKRAIGIITKYKATHYSAKCPHCKTGLVGWGITPDVLRIRCWHCKKEIIIDWESRANLAGKAGK